MIVDGTGQILGRLASKIAKTLLEGEQVVLVNAEKIVISGKKRAIFERYKKLFDIQSTSNPERHNPKRSRRPDLFVKRAIRGMLPRKTKRGREALKRLRVYIGVPQEYERAKKVRFQEADASKLKRTTYITVGDLCKMLGWRGYE